MARRDRVVVRRLQAVGLLALLVGLFVGLGGPSSADVTAVVGSAMDYRSDIGLFGGPSNPRGPAGTTGCDPNGAIPGPGGTRTEACHLTVTLPSTGGDVSQTDDDSSAIARYAPAIVFSRGAATVSSEGTTGPSGSVTSTADIQNINTSQQEVFTATQLVGTCTASETGVSGSTTITGGTLRISEGDPNVDGDDTVVTIDENPAPGTAIDGVIEGVGDSFRMVFNEQVPNGDGSLTVNGAHMELLGPTAVGDLIIGQAVCGVTAVAGTTTTGGTDGTTTTTQGTDGTTTTTQGTDGTTTTTGITGTTTTTRVIGTTTTTRVIGTTTTTRVTGTTTTTRPSGVTTTTRPPATPGPGSGNTSGGGGSLARTGFTMGLAVMSAIVLGVGLLLVVGFTGPTRPGVGNGSAALRPLVLSTKWLRRRRSPWNRRRWR